VCLAATSSPAPTELSNLSKASVRWTGPRLMCAVACGILDARRWRVFRVAQKSHGPEQSSSEAAGGSPLRGGRVREVGEILDGKLRFGRLIGAGGMGTVYEASDVGTGRPVAVKLLHPFLAAGSGLTRFQREAQAAANVRHDNIVAVHEFGVAADGTAFIVMELLEGEDLRHSMRQGPLPVTSAAHTIAQAARGLAVAHRSGIVHRDLKPENIFICRNGGERGLAKVLDFGIAKLPSGDPGATTTATGVALGTPHYMAPEQARGAKDIDHRIDLYALGVILYEALSGRKPHGGASYNAILFNILHTPPEPLRKLCPDLPASVCDVVERAMAYAPRDRFASAEDLVASLEPLAEGRFVVASAQWAPAGAPVIGLAGSEATPAAAITGPVDIGGSRRSTARRWAIGLALATAVGLGALAAVRWRATPAVETRPAEPSAFASRPVAEPAAVTTPANPSIAIKRDDPPPRAPRRVARTPAAPPSPRLAAENPTTPDPAPDIDRVNPYHDSQ
jgi:hypothetical protein